MTPTAVIKNPSHIRMAFKAEKKRGLDMAKNAIYLESARLKDLLRKEIKAGAPGGKRFAALGPMATASRRGASAKKPMVRIAYMMRFYLFRRSKTWFARLGYVPKKGASGTPKGSKISWQQILEKQASGFSLEVTPKMRKKFTRMAMPSLGRWTGGGRSGGRSYRYKKMSAGRWVKSGRSGAKTFMPREPSPFFVRRETKLRIPGRPIIEPFWTARRGQAVANMKQNFRQGMKDKIING